MGQSVYNWQKNFQLEGQRRKESDCQVNDYFIWAKFCNKNRIYFMYNLCMIL